MVTSTVLEDRESTSLHPSALGLCIRKQMLRVREYEQSHPMSASKKWELRRFKTYEDYFEDGFTGHDVLVGMHEPLTMGLWSGELDFLIQVGKETALVEAKSVKKSGIRWAPYDHHILQATCYWIMAHEGDLAVAGLNSLYLAYIERWWESKEEVPELAQFDITPTQQQIRETRAAMAAVEEACSVEQLPPLLYVHPEDDPWQCVKAPRRGAPKLVNCEYFSHCWPGMEQQYSEEGTFPF
jgi:hypothetical protein